MVVRVPVRPDARGPRAAVVAPAPPVREVRCPRCDKKLAEALAGTLVIVCPRCKERTTIAR